MKSQKEVETLLTVTNFEFVRSQQPGISFMFSLATPVYIHEYKAQSNCNQDQAFRHSSLVSASHAKDGVLYFVDMRLDGLGLRERWVVEYFERGGILRDCHDC